jgi:nicotinate-nucleotide adenylyltransferase
MNGGGNGGERVAFFGGSFDPPHLGHLAIARAAREALGLDRVLFAPVGAQPLKPHGSTAPFADRVAMTELAIAGDAGFAVSLADAPDPEGKPNYTLGTLRKLRAELAAGSELFCLLGADSFFGLGSWRGGAEIPFAATLIVASRPGQPVDDLTAHLPRGLTLERNGNAGAALRSYVLRNAAGETAAFHVLPDVHVDVSASAIREQVRAMTEIDAGGPKLLPPAVSAYIRGHHLYR